MTAGVACVGARRPACSRGNGMRLDVPGVVDGGVSTEIVAGCELLGSERGN